MIGYKKGILEKLSHLQARMGQGAPLTQYHIKEITIWAQQSVCLQMIAFCLCLGCTQCPIYFWNQVIKHSSAATRCFRLKTADRS